MKKPLRLKSFNIILLMAVLLACPFLQSADSRAAMSKSPRLNIRNLSMKKNSSYKLRIYNLNKDYSVSFDTDDPDTVFIKSSSGNTCSLKAKTPGSATITASIFDAEQELVQELKCNVTVTPSAVSAKFVKNKIKLTVGQSLKMKVSLKPLTAFEQLRFTSDRPDIVSISSNGTITALSPGKTIIRVVIANGKSGTCRITVTDDPYAAPSASPSPIPIDDNESDADNIEEDSDNKTDSKPAYDTKPYAGKKSFEETEYMS